MAEILLLRTPTTAPGIDASATHHFDSFAQLVSFLFRKGNNEHDSNTATVIVLDTVDSDLNKSDTQNITASTTTLDHAEKTLLLRYFFSHLHLIVLDANAARDPVVVAQVNSTIGQIAALVSNRINRVETWTGTGEKPLNDFYGTLHGHVADVVATMTSVLTHNSNKLAATEQKIDKLHEWIMTNITFVELMENHDPENLRRLCHLVGHWSFPAHDLTNDDLVYCVFVILRYALLFLGDHPCGTNPSENELLGFVYLTRDTYKNGNPFHNFRHAVDVVQACFHYLVRLKCFPEFAQFECDPRADETPYIQGAKTLPHTQLLATAKCAPLAELDGAVPHLNPIQSLSLLMAALGHDVGHPGVTNAFLIKHAAPTAQVYSERLVLELYHATVFLNKILCVSCPALLAVETDPVTGLTVKKLISGSILATDMAEHFEYIHRLKEFTSADDKVRLILLLLIKCADISNVTRPLRVLSQWAVALSREFDEVDILEKKIASRSTESNDGALPGDITYSRLPSTLAGVLEANPHIHKGQIFFIQTFAEGLFNSILELLPELRYTCDIIRDNKSFWLARQV